MPRSLRADFPGAWHHVVNRAAVGRELFATASNCALFLDGLGEAVERYAVTVHAYCPMTNHFHLLLMSKSGRLSDFIRFVVGRFTRLHNVRRGVDGAVFRSRFTSKMIDTEAHLVDCLRYIHLNPVKAGLLGMFGAREPGVAYEEFIREGVRGGVRPGGSDTD